MDQEIISSLEPQEKVVWQGVINRKVLFFKYTLLTIVIMAVAIFLMQIGPIKSVSDDGTTSTIPGSVVGVALLIIGILTTLIRFFSFFTIKYLITDKRVLIRSGLIGTDLNSIYFNQIKSSNVNVNLLGKIFSTGTINIDTGKIETVMHGNGKNQIAETKTAYDQLIHIDTPYDVYKNIQITTSTRQESLYSGRADMENHPVEFKKAEAAIAQVTPPQI